MADKKIACDAINESIKKDNKSPSDMRNRCSLNDDVLFFVAFFSLLNDDVPLTSGSIRVVSMELNR